MTTVQFPVTEDQRQAYDLLLALGRGQSTVSEWFKAGRIPDSVGGAE